MIWQGLAATTGERERCTFGGVGGVGGVGRVGLRRVCGRIRRCVIGLWGRWIFVEKEFVRKGFRCSHAQSALSLTCRSHFSVWSARRAIWRITASQGRKQTSEEGRGLQNVASTAKNASHTTPQIQNQVICVVEDYIRQQITDKEKKSTFFWVIADEVTDVSNNEQLAVVLRFVYSNIILMH